MNLPTEIQFSNNRNISYRYDAAGIKLQKTVDYGNRQVTTDYLSGYQYETDSQTNKTEILFFPTAEGYVKALYKDTPAPVAYQYVYNYTDHLGNIRLSYAWDEAHHRLKVLKENNYYPFGLKHGKYNMSMSKAKLNTAQRKEIIQIPQQDKKYKYEYNGKEFQGEFSLNWNDYGARNYDTSLGRWVNLDALAEGRNWLSPYNYTQNNPVLRIDPDGNWDDDYKLDKKTGKITKIRDTNDKFDRLYATDDNGNINNIIEPLIINKASKKEGTIISSLSEKNTYTKLMDTGSTEFDSEYAKVPTNITMESNKSIAWKFFKFVAKNSDVEWSINKYKIKSTGYIGYQVGTYHLGGNNLYGLSYPKSPGLMFNKNFAVGLGVMHSHPNENDVINSMDGDVWVGHSYQYDFGNDKPYYIYFNRKNGNSFVYKILPNKIGDAAKQNTHRKFITF